MTDDRWIETERLFAAALAVAPAERAAVLDDAAPDLRADVLGLLDAHEADGPLSETAGATQLLGLDLPPLSAPEADMEGRRIGPYRVLREVGRGGMGTVYAAERADGAFRQRVALKRIRPDLPALVAGTVRARFLRERDVLAGLAHPAIARLLDGGETDDGEPYFAMEFVDGEPITDYCDARRLTARERLALVLQVCEAVAYAHRRLVVHRDLKPSNVLVAAGDGTGDLGTGDSGGSPSRPQSHVPSPRVKLLDFGVAKLLDPDREQTVLTGEARPYTPDYAAPEQIAGDAVGTAADVWALGVLLHRLLADRRPFKTRHGATTAPTADAEPPSRAASRPARAEEATADAVAEARSTTPDKLRRALDGDLDAIVARCLRPEPDARYPSADALADDLRRHLDGLPVEARRGGRRYVAGRFVRRHRAGVAMAVAGVVALAGFTAALAVENRETARERSRAEATVGFLRDLLAEANALQTGRGDVTVAEMLDEAARRVPGTFGESPAVQAALLLTIGEAYAGLSKYREAEPVLWRALRLRRAAADDGDADLANLLGTLGLVVAERGSLDSAAALQREALALTERLHGPDAVATAHVLNNLAWVRIQQSRADEAERLLLRAIAITDAATSSASADSAATLDGARARSSLGTLRMRQGRYAEAERLEREALALREAVLGPRHPLVALSLSNLAKKIEDGGGPLDEALPYAQRALALRVAISGDSSVAVATSRSNLAAVLRGLGRHAEAVAEARRATSTAAAVFGPDHTATAYARYNLALALHAAGDRAAAGREYAEALRAHESIWGRDHPYTAYVLVPYAKWALEGGDAARAEALVRPAVEARRASLEPESWLTADAEATLGRARLARGDRDGALPMLRAAATTLERQRGPEACPTRQARDALSDRPVPSCV